MLAPGSLIRRLVPTCAFVRTYACVAGPLGPATFTRAELLKSSSSERLDVQQLRSPPPPPWDQYPTACLMLEVWGVGSLAAHCARPYTRRK